MKFTDLPQGVQMMIAHGIRASIESLGRSICLIETFTHTSEDHLLMVERYKDLTEALEYLKRTNNYAYKHFIKDFEPLQQRYLKLIESLKTE